MAQYRYSLDLQLFAGEKTEKATPRRRQEARKKGQVAKSNEVPGALVILCGFLTLSLMAGSMKDRLFRLITGIYENSLTLDLTVLNVGTFFTQIFWDLLMLLVPIFLVTFVIAVLGNYVQIGFLLTGTGLQPKFSKLNPIQGFKRLFSLRSLVEFAKSLFKMSVIGYIVYLTLWGSKEEMLGLAHLPLGGVLGYVGGLTVSLGLKISAALVVMSILDYMYQKYEYEKNLRMSKQDIKDEYKKTEGDPLVKSKIRERQRKMAMQRMMQEVPKADVVITNPTHYAVALKYESGMEAPKVVAKGVDLIALKIREVAKANGVVTMENRQLARALYDQVEIGEMIPAELFQAVAEVLAYVYRLKGRTR